MRWPITVLCLLAASAVRVAAQDAVPAVPAACVDTVEDVHPLLEVAGLLLLPKVLQEGVMLKEYVAGDEFRAVRTHCGDVTAVDALFRRALRRSWNNPYATLAIVAVAVLDHRRFGIRLPVLGPLLWFPLTSEFADEFAQRHEALPARLFPDSPAWGDKDKLQHFFGSALLAVLSGSRGPVDRIGAFVEWGEDRFVVEGTVEARDVEANRRGAAFGFAFLDDRTVLPSRYMQLPLGIMAPDSLLMFEENDR